jgi:hypothetical protein
MKFDPFKLANAKGAAVTPGGNGKPGIWFSRFDPVGSSADLERIISLPKREPLDINSTRAEALVELMTARFSRGKRACACATIDPQIASGKRTCLTRLNAVQAWTLYEIGMVGGLIGSIPVGSGKTCLDLLAPMALEALGVRLSLLLVPPSLLDQLVLDYRLLAEHFRVPTIRVHGVNYKWDVDGAPILHVLPYSRLSLPTSSDWIRGLAPEAIIADECDRLKDVNGAGASRVMRYFLEKGEDVRFLGWTGSLTDKSLTEYGHLCALALKMCSPLPLDRSVLEEWARALDAVDNPSPPGELVRLCTLGERPRDGYRRRFRETMGVIVSNASSVSAGMTIQEKSAPSLPPIVTEALWKLRHEWVRPDTLAGSDYDEELIDAIAVHRCAIELASGIFYRWKFPPINGVPQRTADVKEWYEARKQWNQELRHRLRSREEWLDSPLLCEHAAQRYHGDMERRSDRPEWCSDAWPRWRAIKDKIVYETEAIRISDYLVNDAAHWARNNLGVVWYGMAEFGAWVAEVSGLPLHGGGPNAGKRIRAERGDRSIIASIKSHGRGRDGLQRLYNNQLIAQPPSSATMWEQLLGRLHRQGQGAEAVHAWYYAHTPELQEAIDQALRRAEYVKGTLGTEQKIASALKII